MKKFYVLINLGNEAMQTEEDVSEALNQIRKKILTSNEGIILDSNGNNVGRWWFK
jgi:hypothetical protein